METIYAAIVTSFFSLLIGLLPYFFKEKEIKKNRTKLKPELVKKLTGNWSAKLKQNGGVLGDLLEYDGQIYLEFSTLGVKGNVEIEVESNGKKYKASLVLTGGQYEDRYIKIDYFNVDPSYLHFGVFIVKLDTVPDKMEGRFVGYGAFSKEIISGEITLVKT